VKEDGTRNTPIHVSGGDKRYGHDGTGRFAGLSKSVQKHLKVREGGQGWTDSQMVISLILLNLAGGRLCRVSKDC